MTCFFFLEEATYDWVKTLRIEVEKIKSAEKKVTLDETTKKLRDVQVTFPESESRKGMFHLF